MFKLGLVSRLRAMMSTERIFYAPRARTKEVLPSKTKDDKGQFQEVRPGLNVHFTCAQSNTYLGLL